MWSDELFTLGPGLSDLLPVYISAWVTGPLFLPLGLDVTVMLGVCEAAVVPASCMVLLQILALQILCSCKRYTANVSRTGGVLPACLDGEFCSSADLALGFHLHLPL
jgi:hypothetical protein